jgi:hypothetical protein
MKKFIVAILALAAVVAILAPSQPAQAQVIYGNYCCDGFGVRRCVLVNPLPVGAGCFCVGQGSGSVCL